MQLHMQPMWTGVNIGINRVTALARRLLLLSIVVWLGIQPRYIGWRTCLPSLYLRLLEYNTAAMFALAFPHSRQIQ